MAEYALRGILATLPEADAVRVSSAGTRARSGRPMEPGSARMLQAVGIDSDGFRSHRLTARDLEADLILVADRGLRTAIATHSPRTVRRMLTMRQAGRLLQGVRSPAVGENAADRLADLVPQMHAQRGAEGTVPPGADDVDDPYGRASAEYRLSWFQLQPMFDGFARTLHGHSLEPQPVR